MPLRYVLDEAHARGTAGPGSDVMPFEGSSFEKMLEIGMALGDRSIGTDIVVTRPEEFKWRKQIVGTLEYPAAREGRIVYARPKAGRDRGARVGPQGRQRPEGCGPDLKLGADSPSTATRPPT